MFRTGAQFMILALLAGLALMREARHAPVASWDNAFADFLAMHSPRHEKPAPVVLVGIDKAYLEKNPWPLNPLAFSLFFQSVLPYKPGAVAIDQVLDWDRALILSEDQARTLPQYQQILRANILRAPKMLLGSTLGVPEDPEVIPPLQQVPLIRNVRGRIEDIREFTAIEQEPEEAFRLSSTVGFTNLPADHGLFNSVPLLFRYRGQVTPSFTLQAVMLWALLTPDEIAVELGSHIDLGGKIRIPIDGAGRMRVDFGSPRGGMSLEDLYLATEQKEAGRKPIAPVELLTGSIVLLSRTDPAARTIPLAARRDASPGELFADAIATIQNKSFIRPVPPWAHYTVIGVFMLFAFFVPRWKKHYAVFFGIVALTAYAMAGLAVFNRWLMWVPGVVPVGIVAVCLLFRIVTPDTFGRPKKPVIL